MKNKLLCSLLLSFSLNALADNYVVYMGGGGEPKGDKTMFDQQIPKLKKSLDQKTWKSQIAFNGGHGKTEEVITKNFGSAPPFTTAAFEQIIADYSKKIENGEIKSGDQLLLHMDTHGAQQNVRLNEKSHSIATSGGSIQDYNTGAGSTLTSMDKLDSLIKLASDKGVKLALLDFSCHSGASLGLKQPNTCIISATGPDHYAYGGTSGVFSSQFIKNMKKGRSLEDVFLQARRATGDDSFPMISSPVGLDINDEIYKSITPYLYEYDPKFDKFSPHILKEVAQGEACEAPQRLDSLLALIEEVKNMRNISREATYSAKEANKLITALSEFRLLMDQVKKNYKTLNLPSMQAEEKFCTSYKAGNADKENCINFKVGELLTLDVTWLENFYKVHTNDKSASTYPWGVAMMENINKVRLKKQELFLNFPDLRKQETFFKDQPRLESQTRALSRKVSQAQQDFYHALYLQKSAQDSRPNPCKDFVL